VELSEQQPAVDGFWVPSMREARHQSLAAPGVMVIVQGTGIRIVDRKGRVWFDDDLRLVTVRRTFLGTLVLKSRAQKVRLLPGATKVGLATQTRSGKALMPRCRRSWCRIGSTTTASGPCSPAGPLQARLT
jgi:hypothetical protein